MAEVYQVTSDDIEEALNVLRSLSDYGSSNGSVVKILTENTHTPTMFKRLQNVFCDDLLYCTSTQLLIFFIYFSPQTTWGLP